MNRQFYIAPILIMSLFALPSCKENQQSTETPAEWTEEDRALLIRGLEGSRTELLQHVEDLSNKQWSFKPATGQWSISDVVEHLELQESMHHREIYVLSNTPTPSEYYPNIRENDTQIVAYATDTTQGAASLFVIPRGRWRDKSSAINQFNTTRNEMISFVSDTEKDLRRYYTYRDIPDPDDYRRIRDLHQIVLTTIAHTRRHIRQIERISNDSNYPKD